MVWTLVPFIELYGKPTISLPHHVVWISGEYSDKVLSNHHSASHKAMQRKYDTPCHLNIVYISLTHCSAIIFLIYLKYYIIFVVHCCKVIFITDLFILIEMTSLTTLMY